MSTEPRDLFWPPATFAGLAARPQFLLDDLGRFVEDLARELGRLEIDDAAALRADLATGFGPYLLNRGPTADALAGLMIDRAVAQAEPLRATRRRAEAIDADRARREQEAAARRAEADRKQAADERFSRMEAERQEFERWRAERSAAATA